MQRVKLIGESQVPLLLVDGSYGIFVLYSFGRKLLGFLVRQWTGEREKEMMLRRVEAGFDAPYRGSERTVLREGSRDSLLQQLSSYHHKFYTEANTRSEPTGSCYPVLNTIHQVHIDHKGLQHYFHQRLVYSFIYSFISLSLINQIKFRDKFGQFVKVFTSLQHPKFFF